MSSPPLSTPENTNKGQREERKQEKENFHSFLMFSLDCFFPCPLVKMYSIYYIKDV